MGDYLANLVRRTVVVASVRPRARSIFEPMRGASGALFGPRFEGEKHATIEREDSAIAPTRTHGRPERPAADTHSPQSNTLRIGLEDEKENAASPREGSAAPGRVARPVVDEAPLRAVRATTEQSTDPPLGTTRARDAILDQAAQVRSARQAIDAAPVRAVVDSDIRASAPKAQTFDAVPSMKPPQPSPERAPPSDAQESRAGQLQPTIQHGLRAVFPDRSASVRSAESPLLREVPSANPEIHIAIGRVVVHVASAATVKAATEPRSHTPNVPLEKYLHQRRGGQ